MADHELELDGAQMMALVDSVMARLVPHIESLPDQPASYDIGSDAAARLASSLAEPLPEHGRPLDELLDLLFERAVPQAYNAAGPGYMAYIPGGGLFHSAAADLLAAGINRYVGIWEAAPGLVQLECNVVRWFADLIGLPAQAGGFLTTGGSLANFSAIVTARRDRLPTHFLKGTLYASDQAHHSVIKAALMAGFPEENVRTVGTDEGFRLDVGDLADQLERDRAAGYTPFCVVASAGTTNTGAVDPLDEVAALCAREGLWFHVDAAYGGFFVLTARGRNALRGIERADSVTLDPHKGLFVPYGTGCLLVRDGETLRRAHHVGASYLPDSEPDRTRVDFAAISPELTRDFRGLRVWLPLQLHGIGPFRAALEEKLDLAQYATDQLGQIQGIEIVALPVLTVVAFRYVPTARDRVDGTDEHNPGASLDQLNRRILSEVNRRQRVLLTGTVVHGHFVMRIAIVSFRTHRARVDAALSDLADAIAAVGA